MVAALREATSVVSAYRRLYLTLALHRVAIFMAAVNPTNPVYRRFLGCDWSRVEDCYPYPCYY